MESAKMSMKLLVDKTNQRVLFAEAGKECVDFFFHILSLPLGTVVSFLTKESMVGSLGNLYGSLESLSADYVQESFDKACLLIPNPPIGSSSQVPLLTINQHPPDLPPNIFYTCITTTNSRHINYVSSDVVHRYVSDVAGAVCPDCNKKLDQELTHVPPPADVKAKAHGKNGGYVKGVVTYMIMDDLCVKPMSTISAIALLNMFNVHDMATLEEKQVTLDINLGMTLLKASLMTKTVLTDVFLPKKP